MPRQPKRYTLDTQCQTKATDNKIGVRQYGTDDITETYHHYIVSAILRDLSPQSDLKFAVLPTNHIET